MQIYFCNGIAIFVLIIRFIVVNFADMKKMTIKQYADRCGISVQAAHKRLLTPERYREIVRVEMITSKLFLIEVNTRKGYTGNATMFRK